MTPSTAASFIKHPDLINFTPPQSLIEANRMLEKKLNQGELLTEEQLNQFEPVKVGDLDQETVSKLQLTQQVRTSVDALIAIQQDGVFEELTETQFNTLFNLKYTHKNRQIIRNELNKRKKIYAKLTNRPEIAKENESIRLTNAEFEKNILKPIREIQQLATSVPSSQITCVLLNEDIIPDEGQSITDAFETKARGQLNLEVDATQLKTELGFKPSEIGIGITVNTEADKELLLTLAKKYPPDTEGMKLALTYNKAVSVAHIMVAHGVSPSAFSKMSLEQQRQLLGKNYQPIFQTAVADYTQAVETAVARSLTHHARTHLVKDVNQINTAMPSLLQAIELTREGITGRDIAMAANAGKNTKLTKKQKQIRTQLTAYKPKNTTPFKLATAVNNELQLMDNDEAVELVWKTFKQTKRNKSITHRKVRLRRTAERQRVKKILKTPDDKIIYSPFADNKLLASIKKRIQAQQERFAQQLEAWNEFQLALRRWENETETNELMTQYKESVKKGYKTLKASLGLAAALKTYSPIQKLRIAAGFEIGRLLDAGVLKLTSIVKGSKVAQTLFPKLAQAIIPSRAPLYMRGIANLPHRIYQGTSRAINRASIVGRFMLENAMESARASFARVLAQLNATAVARFAAKTNLIFRAILSKIGKLIGKLSKGIYTNIISMPGLLGGLIGGLLGGIFGEEGRLSGVILGTLGGAATNAIFKKTSKKISKKAITFALDASKKLISGFGSALKATAAGLTKAGTALATATTSSAAVPVVLIVVGIFILLILLDIDIGGLFPFSSSSDTCHFVKDFGVGGATNEEADPNNESKYMLIIKEAEPKELNNEELPITITYTIKITPKNDHILKDVRFEDEVSANSKHIDNLNPNDLTLIEINGDSSELELPTEIMEETILTYELDIDDQYIDTRVRNKISITADIYQPFDLENPEQPFTEDDLSLVEYGDTVSDTAYVEIGDPPTMYGCWPSSGRITQNPFSVLIGSGSHKTYNLDAFDIAAPIGTPIVAPFDGTVCYKEKFNSMMGYWMTLETSMPLEGTTQVFKFLHMPNAYSTGCKIVKRGDKIGEIGNTGNSTGPHLHFGIDKSRNHYTAYTFEHSVLRRIMQVDEAIALQTPVTACD